MRYRVLVALDFLTISKPPSRDRTMILAFLDSLSLDPHRAGDFQEFDTAGRVVQIKVVGRYALTYWADHAVKEVKVIHIELAD